MYDWYLRLLELRDYVLLINSEPQYQIERVVLNNEKEKKVLRIMKLMRLVSEQSRWIRRTIETY